jgi:hypothetical protein
MRVCVIVVSFEQAGLELGRVKNYCYGWHFAMELSFMRYRERRYETSSEDLQGIIKVAYS